MNKHHEDKWIKRWQQFLEIKCNFKGRNDDYGFRRLLLCFGESGDMYSEWLALSEGHRDWTISPSSRWVLRPSDHFNVFYVGIFNQRVDVAPLKLPLNFDLKDSVVSGPPTNNGLRKLTNDTGIINKGINIWVVSWTQLFSLSAQSFMKLSLKI